MTREWCSDSESDRSSLLSSPRGLLGEVSCDVDNNNVESHLRWIEVGGSGGRSHGGHHLPAASAWRSASGTGCVAESFRAVDRGVLCP